MPLNPRGARWLEILHEELGLGLVDERRLVHHKDKQLIFGLLEGQQITINPVSHTVNTLVHELFHRRYPKWSEQYVRARTEEVCSRLSCEEELLLWKQYNAVVKRKKRQKVV